jgi:hypothetical protein
MPQFTLLISGPEFPPSILHSADADDLVALKNLIQTRFVLPRPIASIDVYDEDYGEYVRPASIADLPHPRAKLHVTLQRVLVHEGLLADLQPGSTEFVDAAAAIRAAADVSFSSTVNVTRCVRSTNVAMHAAFAERCKQLHDQGDRKDTLWWSVQDEEAVYTCAQHGMTLPIQRSSFGTAISLSKRVGGPFTSPRLPAGSHVALLCDVARGIIKSVGPSELPPSAFVIKTEHVDTLQAMGDARDGCFPCDRVIAFDASLVLPLVIVHFTVTAVAMPPASVRPLLQPIDFVGDVSDHGGHRLHMIKPLHQAASASIIVGVGGGQGGGGGPPQHAPLRACPEHSDEVARLFCEQCRVVCCAMCVLRGSHSGHKYATAEDAVVAVRPQLVQMSEAADATVSALQSFAGELRDISSSIEQQLRNLKTCIHRDIDELQHALELRRSSMLQRADDITTQMAAAIFKQEEQVLKDIAVYSAVLARTRLAQTPGYEVHLIEELDSIKAQLLAVTAAGQNAPVAPNIW